MHDFTLSDGIKQTYKGIFLENPMYLFELLPKVRGANKCLANFIRQHKDF